MGRDPLDQLVRQQLQPERFGSVHDFAGAIVNDELAKLTGSNVLTTEQRAAALDSTEGFQRTILGLDPMPFHLDMARACQEPDGLNVFIAAVEHGKSAQMRFAALEILAKHPDPHIGIIRRKQTKGREDIRFIASTITGDTPISRRYREIAPHARPATGDAAVWTDDALQLERPAGARQMSYGDLPDITDPSVAAFGLNADYSSCRWTHAFIDDVTWKEDMWSSTLRERKVTTIEGPILSRLLPGGALVIFANAWHVKDAAHVLGEREGWNLRRYPAGERKPMIDALGAPELNPSGKPRFEWENLRWRQPTPDAPFGWTSARLERRFVSMNSLMASAMLLCRPPSDETSRFDAVWFERAVERGHQVAAALKRAGGLMHGMRVAVGVDVAFGSTSGRGDLSAIVATAALPTTIAGVRKVVLSCDAGRWKGDTLIARLTAMKRKYGAMLRVILVEKNNAQFLIEQAGKTLPVVGAHTTAKRKFDPATGIESWGIDLAADEWAIIESDETQDLILEALAYHPREHAGDRLVAAWLAREALGRQVSVSGVKLYGPADVRGRR